MWVNQQRVCKDSQSCKFDRYHFLKEDFSCEAFSSLRLMISLSFVCFSSFLRETRFPVVIIRNFEAFNDDSQECFEQILFEI